MFDPLLAYGVSICGILLLGLMAQHNRRSGWRRERRDLPMEVLLQGLFARAETYTDAETPFPGQGAEVQKTIPAIPSVSVGLLALHDVVGSAKAPLPVETPDAPTVMDLKS